jgi:hypothetical protein
MGRSSLLTVHGVDLSVSQVGAQELTALGHGGLETRGGLDIG